MTMYRTIICILVILADSLVSAGWIDPETPTDDRFMLSPVDKAPFHIVFSDEFNVEGRDFSDGMDPRWTAIDKDDYTNNALHYYNDKLVTTSNGCLNISTIVQDVTFEVKIAVSKSSKHEKASTDESYHQSHSTSHSKGTESKTSLKTKHYQSGMLQGWNKFCFTGGILEIRARLPGNPQIGGLWPAMWLMGNLARATYVESSDNVWPWSYDTCPAKKEKSKTYYKQQQTISACDTVQHFGLSPKQGRGAPEIDLLEAMPGTSEPTAFLDPLAPTRRPFFSSSLQVSPALDSLTRPYSGEIPRFPPTSPEGQRQRFIINKEVQRLQQQLHVEQKMKQKTKNETIVTLTNEIDRLNTWLKLDYADDDTDLPAFTTWYDQGLSYGTNTSLNTYYYGTYLTDSDNGAAYTADSVSANTNLHATHFDEFHTYTLEWQPRTYSDRDHSDSDITDAGYLAWYLDGVFLYRIDGNALEPTQALIPEEPMYILLNTAISSTWGFPSPCPDGCPCCTNNNLNTNTRTTVKNNEDKQDSSSAYDCRRAECACALPNDMCANLPANFLIDYVRVYQTDDMLPPMKNVKMRS